MAYVKYILWGILPYVSILLAYLTHHLGTDQWVNRKVIHIGGAITISLIVTFNSYIESVLIAAIFVFIFGILSLMPRLTLFQYLLTIGTRPGESQVVSAVNSISTILSIAISLFYFDYIGYKWIFLIGIFSLALGDGMGELIGRPFGKHKYKIFGKKTIEGSIAVFVGTYIGAVFATLLTNHFVILYLSSFLIVAFIAMIIEALSIQFIDNLFMPPMVAYVAYLLLR